MTVSTCIVSRGHHQYAPLANVNALEWLSLAAGYLACTGAVGKTAEQEDAERVATLEKVITATDLRMRRIGVVQSMLH
jgi:hypothetical protein